MPTPYSPIGPNKAPWSDSYPLPQKVWDICKCGGAPSAQCAHSATIWASGRSRNPYFVVLWASLLFGSRFRRIGDMAFLDVHPVSPISTFLHMLFTHFHHTYSFSRLIDMVIHLQGACYRTSYFPPHFSGPPSPWISLLGIGCSIPAPTACDLLPRWLGLLKTDSSTWNTSKMG